MKTKLKTAATQVLDELKTLAISRIQQTFNRND